MFETFQTRFKCYLMYFALVNTWHALGFSVFLMVDRLTSIRCHLRATESRLNALFSIAGTLNAQ